MFAQVVLDLPLITPFHYQIPEFLQTELQVGQWVEVPFNNRFCQGVVVGVQKETPSFTGEIKRIKRIVHPDWRLPEDLLRLTEWISRYYCCSWGEALAAAVPSKILAQRQRQRGQVLTFDKKNQTLSICQMSRLDPSISFDLTLDQKASLERITSALEQSKTEVFLLHGVTASGKTEIYLRSIERVLAMGKSAIFLVPEIVLTPQLIGLFRAKFQEKIAVSHSRLSDARRNEEWRRIYDGSASVVIGARSAIFAPAKNLGIIIVDEEHESTYKQGETPRYHARDAAIERARLNQAVVILGSATPSLESYAKAKEGKYRLLSLPQRVEKKALPGVLLVDMREEVRRSKQFSVFSKTLKAAIEGVLSRGEQGILFINRRGFSPFVQCQACGEVVGCQRCSVGLAFHTRQQKLICHYCGYQIPPPAQCDRCRQPALRYLGIGTEKVESELVRLFPTVRVARLDSDSTRGRNIYESVFQRFKKGELDFLVGTQMVAKGFDFPGVTMVGVVLADVTLHLTDFRSAERTFSLLTQVAGRSGRGKKAGKVIIQTFSPDHYAIKRAQSQDYEGFYAEEFRHRQETRFPPVVQLVEVLFKGKNETRVVETAKEMMALFKESSQGRFDLLGLSPCPVSRMHNQYYWHLLLRGEVINQISERVQKVLKEYKQRRGVSIKIDVDPY